MIWCRSSAYDFVYAFVRPCHVLRSFDVFVHVSFIRPFHDFVRSAGLVLSLLYGSFVRSFHVSVFSFVISFVRSMISFVRFVRSFIRSFVRSFRSFVRSFVPCFHFFVP